MKIETKTQKGVQTFLSIENGKIHAELMTPHLKFEPSEWNTVQGIEGVAGTAFYQKKKVRVCLTIPKTDWERAEAEKTHQINELTEKAMVLKIVGFEYLMGCDSADSYSLIYEENNLPFDFMYKRIESDSSIIESLKLLSLNEVAQKLGADPIEATMSTYGGYRFSQEHIKELFSLAEKEQIKLDTKEQSVKNKEENRRAVMFAKAKETNEPQILSSWITSECTSKDDIDCSFDQATTYAMPDGSTKTTYIHCH